MFHLSFIPTSTHSHISFISNRNRLCNQSPSLSLMWCRIFTHHPNTLKTLFHPQSEEPFPWNPIEGGGGADSRTGIPPNPLGAS